MGRSVLKNPELPCLLPSLGVRPLPDYPALHMKCPSILRPMHPASQPYSLPAFMPPFGRVGGKERPSGSSVGSMSSTLWFPSPRLSYRLSAKQQREALTSWLVPEMPQSP